MIPSLLVLGGGLALAYSVESRGCHTLLRGVACLYGSIALFAGVLLLVLA